MKCIKAIRATKHSDIGDIKRLTEVEADEKVSTGYWKFVPKMEWKEATRGKKVEAVREELPANVEGSTEFNSANQTISEKQLNKKKRSK